MSGLRLGEAKGLARARDDTTRILTRFCLGHEHEGQLVTGLKEGGAGQDPRSSLGPRQTWVVTEGTGCKGGLRSRAARWAVREAATYNRPTGRREPCQPCHAASL